MKKIIFSLASTFILTFITFTSISVSASVNLAPPSLDDPYYFGKVTYHRKLACSSCLLSKTILDKENAEEFICSLETDEQLIELLSEKERAAVAFYLEQFFAPRK